MNRSTPSPRPSKPRDGFTLVELIVSTALIAGIMVLLLGTVDQTQRLWQRQQSKTSQFQSARAAFESMSRRLSQATLNTYWKPHQVVTGTEANNYRFRRQSDLQFISGPMTRFLKATAPVKNLNDPIDENYPTHSLFFAAPLGFTSYIDKSVPSASLQQFRSLDSTLTGCGYFIEFGDDANVPAALRNATPPYPPRLRYRLMELTEPAERFNIYSRPMDDSRLIDPRIVDETTTSSTANYYGGMVDTLRVPITSWVRPLWMKNLFTKEVVSGSSMYRFPFARPIAENVVALIVLPKLAVKDRVKVGTKTPDADVLELAPKYQFDSWRVLSGATVKDTVTNANVDNRARDNLLPPIVQLTMVVIDEPSAIRMSLKQTGKPDWANKPSALFQDGSSEKKYLSDITELEKRITDYNNNGRVQYRIFTTDVVIRGSKWSRDP